MSNKPPLSSSVGFGTGFDYWINKRPVARDRYRRLKTLSLLGLWVISERLVRLLNFVGLFHKSCQKASFFNIVHCE